MPRWRNGRRPGLLVQIEKNVFICLLFYLYIELNKEEIYMGRIPKWRTFSDEELKEIVASSFSNREVARKLGYECNGGGTMASLRKMYEDLSIDTSHFKG
jgi:hypothetical protein